MTILGVFTALYLLILCVIIYAMVNVQPRREFVDIKGVPILRSQYNYRDEDKLVIYKLHPEYNRDELSRLLHGENTTRPQLDDFGNRLDSDDDDLSEEDCLAIDELQGFYDNYSSEKASADENPLF